MIKDTLINFISQKEVQIEGMSALLRQWSWGGIIAELVIFQNDDVSNRCDSDLWEFVKSNY
jgi:hypothetical protein